MSKRDIGQEILDGIRDIKAHKAGERVLRVHTLKETGLTAYNTIEIEVIANRFCRVDGGKCAYGSRLGTGKT